MPGAPTSDGPESAAVASRHDHVIVCGLHELGLSIVEQLHFSGVGVVVVDDQADRRLLAIVESWSVPHINGSPRSAMVLTAAGALTARAVICVEDNDLHTIETALTARSLRPELRIVVQMANAAVARALTKVTGPGSALDVADLAAPSLVQACLGHSQHDIELAGERFSTLEVIATESSTLRSLYGDLVPISVVEAGQRSVDVCPGRDRRIEPGDRIMLLGTPNQLDPLPGWPPPPPERFRRHPVLELVTQLPRAIWSRSELGFRIAFGLLLALVVGATLTIHFGYLPANGQHLDLLTSLYFTVETVATVGFGDFSFATQSDGMRIFGIALIIVGASLVTTMFALLTNFLVSRTLANALGTTRGHRLRNHIVIVGLGAIGLRVVETLQRMGRSVIVIERDEENRHLAQVRALHVPIIIGDATHTSMLDRANVRAASAVAVLTSSDLTNLETAISLDDYLMHKAVDPPVIVRLFDRSLARTVEENFGLRYVRSTTALAAPWFVGAALGLDIVHTFSVEHERLLVARLTVAPEGGLAGLAMQDLAARIRVIAIQRADSRALEHPPRRDTRFAPGDRAYLIGPYEELLTVLHRDAERAVPAEAVERQ